jgi:rRNA-processing protein FCF1
VIQPEEAVAESATHNDPDLRRRRSTRIVQAVPLTVTGVDALGRPFQERTSTLLISCHGCRYQSKHYVLKNMWVTLEVPHHDAARQALTGRGRVTWIQRPRTVRELFQIGVEMEMPGNIWGIAFPPPDWFPAAESNVEDDPQQLEAAPAEPSAPDWSTPGAAPQSDNVVVIGAPAQAAGGDVALQLARQMARLVVEAKQQLQAAVREATSKTVTQEVKQLIAAVESQIQDSANKAVHSAAENYSKHWMNDAAERIELQARSSAEALRQQLSSEMDARIEESRTLVSARLAGVELAEQQTFEAALSASVDAAIDRLRLSAETAAARAEQAREQFEQSRQQLRITVEEATRRWEEVLSGRTTGAASQIERLQSAADRLSQQIDGAIEQGEHTWRARMESDLTEAQKRAAAQASQSVEHAAREAAARIAQHSEQEMARVQAEAAEKFDALRRQADELDAQAARTLAEFRTQWEQESARGRASLDEIQHASGNLDELSRKIDETQQAAISQLEQRSNSLLEHTSRELDARAGAAISGMAERLQPVLDEAGAQSVAHLGRQLEAQLAPHVDRANEVIGKLSSAQNSVEEAFRTHQDRLWRSSEQHIQHVNTRLQQSTGELEKDLQESLRAAVTKSLEDLDARASDLSHSTMESLFKSSSWYEKKIHTQMQTAMEKGTEQAAEALRVRAGEMSSLFASELDHYSRSFIEHSQSQLHENVKDALSQTQQSILEAVEAGSAEMGTKARRAAQVELERFTAGLRNSFDQSSAHFEAHAVQVRARMSSETRQFISEFQSALGQRATDSLQATRKELESQITVAREAAVATHQLQQQKFTDSLSHASDEAMETYKGRMENASNAWLLTSAATLSQQAEQQIETLARNAEIKLRDTFTQVFASVGDSLRERLLGVSASLPSTSKPPAGQNSENK